MSAEYGSLSDEELEREFLKLLRLRESHKKENAILHYEPVSEMAWKVHQSTAKLCGVSGGNRSSKTETCIAESVMLTTGMMPERFRTDPVFRSKFRGPISVRIVVESLQTVLWATRLPKFQWFKWNGPSEPGGPQGHYGWIPKCALRGEDWDKSFSNKERRLHVLCRNPDNWDEILGESTYQFMSKDNDPETFASGEFHLVIEDEPPLLAQHTENEVRVQSVNGRIMLAMTWPDDPAIPVTWLYDQIYEPGQSGPNKNPDIDWFELDSRDNPHASQEGIAFNMSRWSKAMIDVRIKGQPMRMSSRVHPLFTDHLAWWCFSCKEECYVENAEEAHCKTCNSQNVVSYNHVVERDIRSYPVVYCLDPHPRKPHMMMWVAVTPMDDFYQIAEAMVDGSPGEVHEKVAQIEREHELRVAARIMDPNMGLTSPGVRRGITWQSEFEEAGLRIDLADDSRVGIDRVNEYLAPDPDTLMPRMYVHPRCTETIRQFRRYQWDNWKVGAEKGVKEDTKKTDDDFPTLWKYLVNYNPSFRFLKHGAPVLGRKWRKAG